MGKRKISESEKEKIKESGLTSQELAKRYNVHVHTIRKIKTKKKGAYDTESDLTDNYGGNF